MFWTFYSQKVPELFIQVKVREPLGDSDHGMVLATLCLFGEHAKDFPSTSQRFDWKHADWVTYEVQLQRFDWDSLYSSTDVNLIYDGILDAIWYACRKAVPLFGVKRKKTRPSWETSAVRSARKRRREAEHAYKIKLTEATRKARNQAANVLKQTVKKAIIEFEKKLASAPDPKQFWKYSRSKLRPHPTVGPLFDPASNDLTDDPEQCAQIFADFYAGIFSTETDQIPFLKDQTRPSLPGIKFYPAFLQRHLKRKRDHASPGPDKVSYLLLKRGVLLCYVSYRSFSNSAWITV